MPFNAATKSKAAGVVAIASIFAISLTSCTSKGDQTGAKPMAEMALGLSEVGPNWSYSYEYRIYPDGRLEFSKGRGWKRTVAPKSFYQQLERKLEPVRGYAGTSDLIAQQSQFPQYKEMPYVECGQRTDDEGFLAVNWNGAYDTSFANFDLSQNASFSADCRSLKAKEVFDTIRSAIKEIESQFDSIDRKPAQQCPKPRSPN